MATLREICTETQLAVGTVSEILRGRSGYSEQTRRRVLEVANRLNYRPNQLARGLRSQRSGTVGVLFASLAAPAVTMVKLAQIEKAARARGYGVLIANHDGDGAQERTAIDRLLSNQVEGLVLWSSNAENESLVRGLVGDRPLVTIESPFAVPTVDLSVNRELGVLLQIRHLLGELKRKRLVLAIQRVSAGDKGPAAAKWRGYERGLAEFGQTFADHWLIELPAHVPNPYEVGREVAQQIVASDRPFDGVVASSDAVALPILSALIASGRRVPQDIAVIGFDDEPFAANLPVPLSTIRQPEAVGTMAFDLLVQQMAAEPGESPIAPRRHVLSPVLVPRASTVGNPDRAVVSEA